MKKILFGALSLIICLYLLSAGSLSFFSKLGTSDNGTELCDIDGDKDSESKEAKDGKEGKEDGCEEDIFIEIFNAALLPVSNEVISAGFHDPHFFVPGNVIEKSSPPPRA